MYYSQPLLHTISAGLGVSQTAASLLVTVTQIGYAAGLLLLVPVGDIVRRRPLFTGLLAVDTVALAASSAAPGLQLLGVLAAIIGLTSVVVQMLIPYAATLAADHERSKVLGTLISGLLTGILLWPVRRGRWLPPSAGGSWTHARTCAGRSPESCSGSSSCPSG